MSEQKSWPMFNNSIQLGCSLSVDSLHSGKLNLSNIVSNIS